MDVPFTLKTRQFVKTENARVFFAWFKRTVTQTRMRGPKGMEKGKRETASRRESLVRSRVTESTTQFHGRSHFSYAREL